MTTEQYGTVGALLQSLNRAWACSDYRLTVRDAETGGCNPSIGRGPVLTSLIKKQYAYLQVAIPQSGVGLF